MENIISKVLEAEEAAHRMVEEAKEKARINIDRAKEDAAHLKDAEIQRHVGEREGSLLKAEEDAAGLKRSALDEAARQAEAMVQEKSGVAEAVAVKFFEAIIKGRS